MDYPTSTTAKSGIRARTAIATSLRQIAQRWLMHIAQQAIIPILQNSATDVRGEEMAGWRVGEEFVAVIQRIGISYLTQNAEPRITHFIHADGKSTWRIYDPYSEQSVVCHSVAEVREWLEDRYSYRFRC